ncbi:replication initiation protein RepM [Faucicola mancuniensis]|uniref:replication initiation protein RepM n=1 Tax=Faucicola mancuniensis TaxID=1309795 RepID=UPI0039779521
MSKNLIVKDNALINASYNLELIEQRLILLAIGQSRKIGQDFNAHSRLKISVSDYINIYSTHGKSVYENIKKACKVLFERQFTYMENTAKGKRIATTRWVSEIAYIDEAGMIDLTFAPAVIPLINLLEKHFTSYELEQVAGLNSKYAVRLYELVIAWRTTSKTPMLSVDELRQKLGVVNGEYQKMEVLKRRVLDFSVQQINEKTDIDVKYEQQKQGRKIIGFTFSFKQKKNRQKSTNDNSKQNSMIKMTEKQRLMFAKKLANLPELGSYAPIGASIDDFVNKIADELLDPTKSEFYKPFLGSMGFNLGAIY